LIDGVHLQTLPTVHLPDNANFTLPAGRLVKKIFERFAPEIVHVQDHYFVSRLVWRVAQQKGVCVVGTNHFIPQNLIANLPLPRFLEAPLEQFLWRNMLNFFNRLTAATTPTQTAVKILRTQALDIPVQAISCGVDLARFRPHPTFDRAEIRRLWGLNPAKVLFLYVGRIDHEKNLDLLIDAAARLDQEKVQIAIAGKGSHLSALIQQTRQLNLAREQVVFLGFIPDDDLPQLLNAADYFVMPSTAELQSIATMEAMASGLPILAANARALPELVHHDMNGYLFEPGDAANVAAGLRMLYHDYANRAEMSQASLMMIQKHDFLRTIQQYAAWYEHCLEDET
jgi:glycosyltransferase involved in cell wall biosynthesis